MNCLVAVLLENILIYINKEVSVKSIGSHSHEEKHFQKQYFLVFIIYSYINNSVVYICSITFSKLALF